MHSFCFLKRPIERNQGGYGLGLMETMKKFELFRKSFWLGFGVKQIIYSLSFLFLLTHIGLSLNEKVLE